MKYTSEDIRRKIENLKELIEKNETKAKIKNEQIKLNEMLEEFLKNMK